MNTPRQLTPSRYAGLAGRTVLITGGASGIGASLVAHFVAQGCKVGFIDVADEAGTALASSLASALASVLASALATAASAARQPANRC